MEQRFNQGHVSGRIIGNKIPTVHIPTMWHKIDDIKEAGKLSVIRSGRIGDMVMLEPVVRFMSSIVTTEVVTKPCYQFMFNCPVVCKPTTGYYTVNLDSYAEEHLLSSTEHRTDIFATAFGAEITDHSNKIPVDNLTLGEVKLLLDDNVNKQFIVVAPRSVSPNRTWDGIHEVIKLIRNQFSVVEVDSSYWKVGNELVDPLSINHLYSLVSMASLVISPDTGVMHLAGALGIPFIGIWTGLERMSSNPFTRCKYYRNYSIVENPTVFKVKTEALKAMSDSIKGQELVTKLDQTVHDGPRVYRFKSGVPLWIPEEYVQRLLNTGEFFSVEIEPVPVSKGGNRIAWIMDSSNYGGAEKHTVELMRHFKKLGFVNYAILMYDWSGSLIKELNSLCENVIFSSRTDSTKMSSDIARCNPSIVIQSTITGAHFRPLWRDIPHIFIIHSTFEHFICHENTSYVFTSVASAEVNKVSGTVIPNGVDVDFWSSGKYIRSRLGISPEEFVVVYSGRLSPEKNIPLLVRACALMDFKLLIAGSGVEQNSLEALVNELEISDKVKFLGYVASSGLRNVLKSANLLVLPSNTESMPLCLLEAMAAGCPVVATDVGDVPRVLDNGNNGIVIEKGSLEQLCSAIQEVISDPVSTEIRVNNAKATVEYNHNLDTMNRKYARVVGDIVGIPMVSVVIIDRVGENLDSTVNSVLGTYDNLDVVILTNNVSADKYATSSVRVLNVDVPAYSLSSLVVAAKEYILGKYCIFMESGDTLVPNWVKTITNSGYTVHDAVLTSFKFGETVHSQDFRSVTSVGRQNSVRCPLSTMFIQSEVLSGFNITSKDMSTSTELAEYLTNFDYKVIDDISTICMSDPKYSYTDLMKVSSELFPEGGLDDELLDLDVDSIEDIESISGEDNG